MSYVNDADKLSVIEQINDKIKQAKSIAISGHTRPDGDCIGSVLAMYLYIKKINSEATTDMYLDRPSNIFKILEGVENIKQTDKCDIEYELMIVLDGEPARLGAAYSLYEKAGFTINIDHHISNNGIAMINYIVPEAAATGELVMDIIDPDIIDEAIAKALYVAISTDTGCFRFSNTSPNTHRRVADLISYGFDFTSLLDKLYYSRTYHQSQILGRALLGSIRILEDRCIFTVVTKRMMEFYNVTSGDLDPIVNNLLSTDGVSCAIFLTQLDIMSYKVSMRSDGTVNVAEIATRFGGGGHYRAAGCTMQGTSHDVINNLSVLIQDYL